jgi:hypothetical protein
MAVGAKAAMPHDRVPCMLRYKGESLTVLKKNPDIVSVITQKALLHHTLARAISARIACIIEWSVVLAVFLAYSSHHRICPNPSLPVHS